MSENFRITSGLSALLIDGDNIPPSLATTVLAALPGGDLPAIRRVYGNFSQHPGWAAQQGFRAIHSGTGKNASDLLLCIDAIDLLHGGSLRRVIIVSSDGDFSHLAHRLRESGVEVIGIGEAKTPANMKAACDRFIKVAAERPEKQAATTRPADQPAPKKTALPPVPKKPVAPPMTELEAIVFTTLRAVEGGALTLQDLNQRIAMRYSTGVKESRTGNWRQWLTQRPHLFVCDPKGPQSRVRLKS